MESPPAEYAIVPVAVLDRMNEALDVITEAFEKFDDLDDNHVASCVQLTCLVRGLLLEFQEVGVESWKAKVAADLEVLESLAQIRELLNTL